MRVTKGDRVLIFPQDLPSAVSLKIAFSKYGWASVLRRDGIEVKESQIVGFSRWDSEQREVLIQANNSIFRILVSGHQPIDRAIDLHRVLELSPPTGWRTSLTRIFLHPKQRRILAAVSVVALTTLFMGDFIYRIFDVHFPELVNYPLAALPVLAVPMVFLGSVFFQRQTRL